MRQIGSRQEAGRLGGIGSCGRELCCSTWLTDFRTVSTSAARYQQLSINPMKMAGQCGKLKCCLNYELDSYMDAIKDFPDHKIKLKTKKGTAFHQKSDIFKGMMWYAYEDNFSEFIRFLLVFIVCLFVRSFYLFPSQPTDVRIDRPEVVVTFASSPPPPAYTLPSWLLYSNSAHDSSPFEAKHQHVLVSRFLIPPSVR